MRIDSGHVWWAAGTSAAAVVCLGVSLFLDRRLPGGLTGGTKPGLWLGVVTLALMLYCGLFAILRQVPGWWWIGSRKAWLRAHIWLGLLSVVILLCHSGFRLGGGLGLALWIAVGVIIGSGLFGLALQQSLPGVMTRELAGEASYEQLSHYCGVLRRRADELADALEDVPSITQTTALQQSDFKRTFDENIRPLFDVPIRRTAPLQDFEPVGQWFAGIRERLQMAEHKNPEAVVLRALEKLRDRVEPDKAARVDDLKKKAARLLDAGQPEGLGNFSRSILKDVHALADGSESADLANEIDSACRHRWMSALEDLCVERIGYRDQERYHRWLHGWLLLHAPFSAALLVLTIFHIVMSLYY